MNKKIKNNNLKACAQNRVVSPQRAQAREMNNKFNIVSVKPESRPIRLLIILKNWKLRANSNHLFFCILTQRRAELCCTQVSHFAGPAFSSPAIWTVLFQVLHFLVFVLFWCAIFRSCKFSAPYRRFKSRTSTSTSTSTSTWKLYLSTAEVPVPVPSSTRLPSTLG